MKNIILEYHKSKFNINNTRCKIKYDSQGNLLTKPHYPFHDLENCQNFNCPPHYYKCRSFGYCIPIENYCDGLNHCYLGDDEINCGLK